MILRDRGLLLTHIPKTGGTSLEQLLGITRGTIHDPPDYELAWGWCPDRSRWLQHLNPQEMVELDLLSEQELDQLVKVVVIRDPTARALSAFRFLRRENGGRGQLTELFGSGKGWEPILADPASPQFRGDHLKTQSSYVRLPGVRYDHIGRTESLGETVQFLQEHLGTDLPTITTKKKSFRAIRRTADFLTKEERDLVVSTYREDFLLGYGQPAEPTPRAAALRWLLRPLEAGHALVATSRLRGRDRRGP